MNRLLRHDIHPPEPGFRYRHVETGHTSYGGDYDDWLIQVAKHRKANNLSELTVAQIEDQLCSTLPAGWCEEVTNRATPLTRVTWGDIYQGMQVFIRWFAEGKPYVTQNEAERRAAICKNCYLNVNVEGCGSCRDLAQFIKGDARTSLDPYLQSCGCCKCLIKAKVHFPLNILESVDSQEKQSCFPAHCWLKRGGSNYKP